MATVEAAIAVEEAVESGVGAVTCAEREGLLSSGAHEEAVGPRRRGVIVTVAAALAFAGAASLGAAVWLSAAAQPTPPSALTVRGLMQSEEFRDLTADNLLALSEGEATSSFSALAVEDRRALARQRVGSGLRRLDEELAQRLPGEHRRLGELEVGEDHKVAALRMIHVFGDPRMLDMGRSVRDALGEHAQAAASGNAGSEEVLSHRLAAKLQPKLDDLLDLQAEFPSCHVDVNSSLDSLPGVASRRHSAATDGVEIGVAMHAQALLESLHGRLGERMPVAPARMLSLVGDEDMGSDPKIPPEFAASTMPPPTDGQSKEARDRVWMHCIVRAGLDRTKIVKCIAQNMEGVVSLILAPVTSDAKYM